MIVYIPRHDPEPLPLAWRCAILIDVALSLVLWGCVIGLIVAVWSVL